MWWCVVWCFIFSYHAIILRLIPITSNIWCSLQSTRLIETSIMDFRFHNCHYPLLSSLTLYSRNQNCNNYFHHDVKQKYIKQNISRYFILPPLPSWLTGCRLWWRKWDLSNVGGQASVFRVSLHLDMSCPVLSCHQLHPVTSFHMTSTITASGSRWCLPSISRYECSYTVMLIQSGRVSHYNWVID